jgi:hypothetical protein
MSNRGPACKKKKKGKKKKKKEEKNKISIKRRHYCLAHTLKDHNLLSQINVIGPQLGHFNEMCVSLFFCLSFIFSVLNFHISPPIDPDHFRVKAYAERDGRRPWRGHDVQGLHGAPPKALARAHREGHVRYHVVSVSPLFFPLLLCFNLFSINKTLISFHNQLLGCIQIRYPRSACLMLFIII